MAVARNTFYFTLAFVGAWGCILTMHTALFVPRLFLFFVLSLPTLPLQLFFQTRLGLHTANEAQYPVLLLRRLGLQEHKPV